MLVGQKSYSLVKFKRLDQPEAEKLLHQTRHDFRRFKHIDEVWLSTSCCRTHRKFVDIRTYLYLSTVINTDKGTMMNIITIAEIKRGGMAALDAALNLPQQGGTATIMKRNRPAAVVLTPQVYEALLNSAAELKRSGTALDWLLTVPATMQQQGLDTSAVSPDCPDLSKLDANGMTQRLHDLRSEWPVR